MNNTRNGIGSHQSAKMLNDEWLTDPNLIKSLGTFDLDPCSPINRPWDTARRHLNKIDDGLKCKWDGRVWMNAPYGQELSTWMARLAEYGNGIALTFARTETKMFFESVWPKADAVLFIKGRLYFYYVTGEKAKANSGAPSILIAYGHENAIALEKSGIPGHFQRL